MSGFSFLEDFIPKEQSPLENSFLRVSEPFGGVYTHIVFRFEVNYHGLLAAEPAPDF
jgi:hypothetical protein